MVLPAFFLNIFFLVPFFLASSSTPSSVWLVHCRVQGFGPTVAQPGFAECSCDAAHCLLPADSLHGTFTQTLHKAGVPCEDSGWCAHLLSRGMEHLLASPCDAGSCHCHPSVLGHRVAGLIVSLFSFWN